MTTPTAAQKTNKVYHIVLFAFRGSKRAGDMLDDVETAQKLANYRILAKAVVERDVQGNVHIHEPGRGGVGGSLGAVAGGLLGLFGGPLAVLVLAVGGGVAGGIAGHFAGRSIPTEDLRRMGNALPPDSSGLVVLLEDVEAERLIDGMGTTGAEVVTITVGDELAGEIDTLVATQVPETAQAAAATPAMPAGQSAPAASSSSSSESGSSAPAAPQN